MMTNSNRPLTAIFFLAAALTGGAPRASCAQSIAQRVASAPDGKVRMTFAARPDVCGHGTFISRGRNSRTTWNDDEYNSDVEYSEYCDDSPVRLVLDVRGRRVAKIRTYVGGRWRAPTGTVTDLGVVPVRAATDYLMSLAESDAGHTSREAIFPLTLADSVVVWPGLVRIARNSPLTGSTPTRPPSSGSPGPRPGHRWARDRWSAAWSTWPSATRRRPRCRSRLTPARTPRGATRP